MLFNSIEFLFLFLPINFFLYLFIKNKFKLIYLSLSSLVFYSFSGYYAVFILCLSIAISFVSLKIFDKLKSNSKSIYFFLSIAFPLLILVIYKYNYFLIGIFKDFGFNIDIKKIPLYFKILLPAGISFYTFQIISYAIDKKNEKKNFETFSTYITFFPQLIAGPILRFKQISFQFQNIKKGKIEINLKKFAHFTIIGLTFKVIFADITGFILIDYKNQINELIQFNDKVGIYFFIKYVFLYSSQIYFDFAGYSLMAIGIATLYGIHLPKNFDQPYLASNPKEFWRKWHISLSYWLRDYVFIKLGGSKKYVRNILIVFALSGLWHGASYNFVIWGIYHAFLVFLFNILKNFWTQIPIVFQIFLTFSLVCLGWPLFDLGFDTYLNFIKQISFSGSDNNSNFDFRLLFWISILFVVIFFLNEKKIIFDMNFGKLEKISVLIYSSLFLMCLIFLNLSQAFIYFRF